MLDLLSNASNAVPGSTLSSAAMSTDGRLGLAMSIDGPLRHKFDIWRPSKVCKGDPPHDANRVRVTAGAFRWQDRDNCRRSRSRGHRRVTSP